MSQLNLFNSEQGLFERVCSLEELQAAYQAVKRNKGGAGIDGVTVKTFSKHVRKELTKLRNELISWKYTPQPVKRVEIPKPSGGKRQLGIPTVRDRVVQTALKNVLEEIFDPEFSAHSYGFRKGKSQKEAITAAQTIVKTGKEYVVDIDLSRFFDRIHHDRLIYRLGLKVPDKRILRLIGKTLRSGIMKEGVRTVSEEGSVQGSPLSPLLSNVVLDELDKELERRGLSFCRWADDFNIFVKSQKAAERVMFSVTSFIEKKLRLVVNREKSQVARTEKVSFLGMTIVAGVLAISSVSMKRAREKLVELIPRGTSQTMPQTMKVVNRWYGGWSNYFKMTQYPSQLKAVESRARRRMRSRIVSQQKSLRNLYRKLRKRGVRAKTALVVYKNHGKWHLSHTSALERAYRNSYFIEELGQLIVSTEEHAHWLETKRWIKLT